MRLKAMHTLGPLIALVFASAPPVHAGGVVSTCDEPSLLVALTGGGTVTFTCSGTITLTATITPTSDTTIDGTGQNVIISGGGNVGVFFVPAGVKLILNKLTVANGGASRGAGIFNLGTVAVTDSTLSGNTAAGGPGGGGIFNLEGTLTVTNSTFSGNSVVDELGGAILNCCGMHPTLTVTNSTFSGNSALLGGGIANEGGALTVINSTFSSNSASEGGGIWGGGTMTVTNSTFSGNSVDNIGGGIENLGTLTVINSTFSGNSAGGGGGVVNRGGTVTMTNGTFSGNSATIPITDGFGGGAILNGGTLTLGNTIVSNSPSGGNCIPLGSSGSLIDGGGNLSWPDTTCPGINQDPLLDPNGLQNNGGPTQTIALSPSSPAIDAAISANCPATDQRAVPRPPGQCDIGAYQLVPFLGSGSFVIGDLNATAGNAVTFWGARWAKDNSLSGGPAPHAFKGFADTTSTTSPACGGTWTADPGNSSGPPDSVPSYMPVIVSSSVTESGATISGNVSKIVIVKTNLGYGPSPGQTGTGTVVAVLCP